MEFNKVEFKEFRSDVEKALIDVAKKYGVDISCGSIRYSEYDFNMPLHVTKNDEFTDGQRLLFEKQCGFYGFKPSDYEREFYLRDDLFKLVGFNSRSPKNNCKIVSLIDGKTYKCSAEAIKRAFNN